MWSSFRFPHLFTRRPTPAGTLEDRWRRLSDAACRTAYYSAAQRKALIRRADHPCLLFTIPPVPLEEFYSQVNRFRNPAAPPSAMEPLAAPWPNATGVAAIAPWFALAGGAAQIVTPSCDDIARLEPQSIAGPVNQLRAVAAAVIEARLQLPSLRLGVVAFTGVGQTLLTPADRDLFWRAFQAPVFEQFRGFQGELLAAECESHEGLHVRTGHAIWEETIDAPAQLLLTSLDNVRHPAFRLGTGLRGIIDRTPCSCGRTEPRVTQLTVASAGSTGQTA